MKFSEGEQVLAKMPSTDEYQKGKVLNIKGKQYTVLFRGGMEHTLNETDLKAQRSSRSQTRTRGRPGKSPSRVSPSRRSPARKSPGRSPNPQARKLPVRSGRQAKISIARLEIPKDNSSDTDRTEGSESLKDEFIEPLSQSRLRDIGPITRRSIRIMSNVAKAEQDHKLMMLRNIDRAVSLPVERKAQYNAVADGKERGFSVQRDEDMLKSMHYEEDFDLEPLTDGKRKEIDLNKPQEWGGWIGVLLLIFGLPIGTILLQIACSKNHCSTKSFRMPLLKEWQSFLNLEAFLYYAAFISFISLISILPIGRLVDGQQSKSGRLQYRINGYLSLLLALTIFGGCTYKNYDISDYLLKNSLPLSVTGIIYGILIAIVLYIKGGRVPVSNLNIYASTNNIIYDFWQGREINPRFGSLDVKLVLLRCALIGTILIDLAAVVKIYKGLESLNLSNLNYMSITVAVLQIFYVGNNVLFESSLLTSFELTYEGTGYMLSIGYLIYPFIATVTTRYLLVHKIHQPIYLIGLCVVTFIIGYIIYKLSNSQKDTFRKNPFDPSISHLETIPTKRGKRLIVSGLWGHVRHPNYLGDIMMHWSISLLSFAMDILPYVLAIQITLLLIHRALRDNARCEQRYGYAWEQYCKRVKYMILNRVF